MELLDLDLATIRPYVRYAEEEHIQGNRNYFRMRAYDHRLFFVVDGEAEVALDGQRKILRRGAVMYCLSGTSYCIKPAQGSDLQLIKVNFDMTQANRELVHPIPVVTEFQWEAECQLEFIDFAEPGLRGPLIMEDMQELLPYLRAMTAEKIRPLSYGSVQLTNLMHCVLTLLFREAQNQRTAKKISNASAAILDYVELHYADSLTNRDLAEKFGYHPNYIGCLVLEQTGMPLHRYLLQLRIRHGINLLTTTQMTVAQIAEAVGFHSSSYFSQYFKQCTGHTPGEYRKGHL
jgi:AraC-like DNA-binding protein